jgi:hypothetical protein
MRISRAKHTNLGNKLFEWVCFAHSNNIPVDGPTIKEKANKIAMKLEIEFQCLNGWLS